MSSTEKREHLQERLRRIPGDAPIGVKEAAHRWLYTFTSGGFGMRTTRCLDLVDVSFVPNVDEPARREVRVVLEMTVTEDMVNAAGNMHSSCIVNLVDMCTTLPIAAMSFVEGGVGDSGVSQNINVIYHAPASIGDKLRLINTSVTIGQFAWSGRIEIWDVTHRRLVATATHVKMEASPPKPKL